jgi:hypothetical protein
VATQGDQVPLVDIEYMLEGQEYSIPVTISLEVLDEHPPLLLDGANRVPEQLENEAVPPEHTVFTWQGTQYAFPES